MLSKQRVLCTSGVVLFAIGAILCFVLLPVLGNESYEDWSRWCEKSPDYAAQYPAYWDLLPEIIYPIISLLFGGSGSGFCGIMLFLLGKDVYIRRKRIIGICVLILGVAFVVFLILGSLQQTYDFWLENRNGRNMPISYFWECYFDRNGACHLYAVCALLGSAFTGWQLCQESDRFWYWLDALRDPASKDLKGKVLY